MLGQTRTDYGMVCLFARPKYHVYLTGKLSTPGVNREHLQWSLNLLQAALDGEIVPFCNTVAGKSYFTGRRFIQENRPELASFDANTISYPDNDHTALPEREHISTYVHIHIYIYMDMEI